MTKRFVAVMVIACVGGAMSASGQTRVTRGEDTLSSLRKSAAKPVSPLHRRSAFAARNFLRKHVQKVDWDERTFEEVIEWLNGEGGDRVNVIPRWKALAQAGVNPDSPVTLRLRDATVAEVLTEALDQVTDDSQLTFRAVGNKLKISTKEDFGRKMEVRTYDLLDLIFVIPDFGENAPTIDLEAASRQGGSSGGGGGGQSVFGGGSTSSSDDLEMEDSELQEQADALKTLIEQMVEPTSWLANGGRGDIAVYNNRVLVVRNTVEVHEKLAGFFTFGR